MTISLHEVSTAVFIRGLENLTLILDKAAAHAAARNIPERVLLQSRLYPDMFALDRQIERTADVAVTAIATIADLPSPQWQPIAAAEEREGAGKFSDFGERLRQAIEFLKSVESSRIDGRESLSISVKRRGEIVSVQVLSYLLQSVIPNFYFHLTTAYDILRHNGVEIGKRDFTGKF